MTRVKKEKKVQGGLFVTLEGIEGSGKSTQQEILKTSLEEKGFGVVCVREPGGTPYGQAARDLFLTHHDSIDPLTEVGLLVSCKLELLDKVIRPALAAGKIVICDRYTDSLYAYQAGGKETPESKITQLLIAFDAGLRPDLTIYLDLSVEESQRRLHKRRVAGGEMNSIDKLHRAFHERVRRYYQQLLNYRKVPASENHPSLFPSLPGLSRDVAVIQGNESVMEVASKVLASVIGARGLS